MRNSIATRLALMFAPRALVAFALIGVALHRVLSTSSRTTSRQKTKPARRHAYMLQHGRAPNLGERIRDKMDTLGAADPRTRSWMLSEDLAFRYGKGLEEERQCGGCGAGHRAPSHGRVTGSPARPGSWDGASGNGIPTVGAPHRRRRDGAVPRTLRIFVTALAILTLAGTALSAALGYWIASIGLGPLDRLSADAQRVGPDNRAQRLQLPALPRELAKLGVAFNAALGRLEDAYRQLATFNADVAHELRTPLANLIGGTQVALARERSAAEFQEALQSNLEELERLRSIVNDMLFLARADQGEARRGLVESSMAQEVGKTVEFFEPLLDETGMTVQVEGDAVAPIEKSLFRRALSNLLQNAIEHSRPGARVVVQIGQHDARRR